MNGPKTLLVVAADYPPFHPGGYELGCQRVLEALSALGWQITVLTNEPPAGKPAPASDETGRVRVWRRLDGATHGRSRFARELFNSRILRATLAEVQPAAVQFWKFERLGTRLAPVAQRAGFRVLHYVSDIVLPRFDRRHDHSQFRGMFVRLGLGAVWPWIGRPLMRAILRDSYYDRPPEFHFCSRFLADVAHEHGVLPSFEAVIPWGISLGQFALPAQPQDPRRLLFVGRIAPEKGVETAILALKAIRAGSGGDDVMLTILGGGDPGYEQTIRALAVAEGLEDAVTFAGFADTAGVAAAYRTHGILVFPSRWEEPFAITPLEGMASGVAVVATATGGSREIFADGENALVFPVDDVTACAHAVTRLVVEPELRMRLRAAARHLVEHHYTLGQMAEKIATRLDQR